MELKRSDLAESPDQHVCRIYANGLAARPSCQEGLCGLAQFQLHSSPDFHQRVSQLAHHYFIMGGSRREAQALSTARNGGEVDRLYINAIFSEQHVADAFGLHWLAHHQRSEESCLGNGCYSTIRSRW